MQKKKKKKSTSGRIHGYIEIFRYLLNNFDTKFLNRQIPITTRPLSRMAPSNIRQEEIESGLFPVFEVISEAQRKKMVIIFLLICFKRVPFLSLFYFMGEGGVGRKIISANPLFSKNCTRNCGGALPVFFLVMNASGRLKYVSANYEKKSEPTFLQTSVA